MVFGRLYGLAYDYTSRHWKMVTALVLAACMVAGIGVFFFVGYDGDMLMLLPRDEGITRSVEYFRETETGGKVVFSVWLKEGPEAEGRGREDLLRAADALAAGLDNSIFHDVMSGPTDSDASGGMDAMFGSMSFLLSPDELSSEVLPRMEREAVASRLKAGYMGMFRPGGVMAGRMIMEDPLGLRVIALNKLSALTAAMGFDVRIEDGHFVSADGRHVLLIASTSILAIDTFGARKLVNSLNESLARMPSYVGVDAVCGHLHTVSNEDTIKSDIRLTLAIATVGFILLFVVFIGDLGSVVVFILPTLSVLVAVNLSYMIMGRLSYSVIGLAAAVAGIAVDYGIHVYIGTKKGMTGDGVAHAVKGMAKPITFGALTTAGMFTSFFTSHIIGHHQMAVFSIISVLISLGLALLVLPHLLSRWGHGAARRLHRLVWLEGLKVPARTAFIVWFVLTLLMGWMALGVRLDPDLEAIDGASPAIFAAEDRFFDAWGRNRPAVLVGESDSLDGARELQDTLYHEASLELGGSGVSSLAALWPSKRSMQQNTRAWDDFWGPEREAKLRALLADEGRKYSYSPEAFEPFFESLHGNSLPEGLPEMELTDRYIRQLRDGSWQVSVFFPDVSDNIESAMNIAARNEGAYVVSGRALGRMIADSAMADMMKMTFMAALAVVGLTLFFLRRPVLVAAALIPVVTSTVWLAGGMYVFGLSLNVASLVAFIVVMGLCVDYGIFMAHRSTRSEAEQHASGTVLAVTLSAMSSLIGAGVLIFANHPALFSVGVTLVIGLSSGWMSSLLVVPGVAAGLAGPKGALSGGEK